MPKKFAKKKTSSKSTLVLFLLGLILVGIPILWNSYQGSVLSFTSLPKTEITTPLSPKTPPVRIRISKFSIDLPVAQSHIRHGVWEINPKGASHLANSANPGEGGNIILYGHNKTKLFGKALGLKIGDEIDLITQDGKQYTYKVASATTVSPQDVSVLAPTNSEVLTFYTCTGFLDTKRFVVKASPQLPTKL